MEVTEICIESAMDMMRVAFGDEAELLNELQVSMEPSSTEGLKKLPAFGDYFTDDVIREHLVTLTYLYEDSADNELREPFCGLGEHVLVEMKLLLMNFFVRHMFLSNVGKLRLGSDVISKELSLAPFYSKDEMLRFICDLFCKVMDEIQDRNNNRFFKVSTDYSSFIEELSNYQRANEDCLDIFKVGTDIRQLFTKFRLENEKNLPAHKRITRDLRLLDNQCKVEFYKSSASKLGSFEPPRVTDGSEDSLKFLEKADGPLLIVKIMESARQLKIIPSKDYLDLPVIVGVNGQDVCYIENKNDLMQGKDNNRIDYYLSLKFFIAKVLEKVLNDKNLEFYSNEIPDYSPLGKKSINNIHSRYYKASCDHALSKFRASDNSPHIKISQRVQIDGDIGFYKLDFPFDVLFLLEN